MSKNYKDVFQSLGKQFVVWGVNPDAIKIPYTPNTTKPAKSNDPNTWGSYNEAKFSVHSKSARGIGLELSDSGIIFVDIDHCVADGEISKAAQSIIKYLSSYAEISQSGTGIHILGYGEYNKNDFFCRKKINIAGDEVDIEIYPDNRYVALTESIVTIDGVTYTNIEDISDKINGLAEKHLKREKINSENEPKTGVNIDDASVIDIMLKSKSGKKISKLMNGDISDYDYDESRADMALLAYLAFFTQKNPEQMLSIFNSSKLSEREKWQKREDYRERSITNAINQCKEVMQYGILGTCDETLSFVDVETKNVDVRGYVEWWISTNGVKLNQGNSLVIDVNGRDEYIPYIINACKTDYVNFCVENKYRKNSELIKGEIENAEVRMRNEEFAKFKKFFDESVSPADGDAMLDILVSQIESRPELRETTKRIIQHSMRNTIRLLNGKRTMYDDIMIVLYSAQQGRGKSSVLQMLLGKFEKYMVTDCEISDLDDKRNNAWWMHNYIAICDDMETGTKDTYGRIKSLITKQTIDYRPMGTNSIVKGAKVTTFWGASNHSIDDIILDTTGNRRFWQIDCSGEGTFDFDVLTSIDFDVIWQSIQWKSDVNPYLTPEIKTTVSDIQKTNKRLDSVEIFLQDYMEINEVDTILESVDISVQQLYDSYCTIMEQAERARPYGKQKFVKILSNLGYKSIVKRKDGKSQRVYVIPTTALDNISTYFTSSMSMYN